MARWLIPAICSFFFFAPSIRADSDQRRVTWYTTVQEGINNAEGWKPILLLGYLKTDDGSSRKMWETVLRDPGVEAVLESTFVCVKTMNRNHVVAQGDAALYLGQVKGEGFPVFAFITPRKDFVTGRRGKMNTGEFHTLLKSVLTSKDFQGPKEAVKKLADSLKNTRKDFESGRFRKVLEAAGRARAARFWCEEKAGFRALEAKVLESGRASLERVLELIREDDYTTAKDELKSLGVEFGKSILDEPIKQAKAAVDLFRNAHAKQKKEDARGAQRYYKQILRDMPDTEYAQLAEERMNAAG